MSTIATYLEQFQFNRSRTIGLLDEIVESEDAEQLLGWRPDDGRAHIAWQLTHIGVTEELFGVERLADRPRDARHAGLWERFRGGSTPDDQIPPVNLIRQVLADGREALTRTLAGYREEQLDDFAWVHPRMNKELTLRDTLKIIGWHESHHQGQAHITRNLHRCRKGG